MDEGKFEIKNLRLVNKDDFIRLGSLLKSWENKLVKKIRVLPNGIVKEEGTHHFGIVELVEDENSCLLQVWTSFGVINIHKGDFIEKADDKRLIIQRYSKDPWNIHKDVLRIVKEQ
jgi:hypothetical protein